MRAKILALLLTLSALPAFAQVAFVTATGTNANYANGTLAATFTPPANTSMNSYSSQRFAIQATAKLSNTGAWSVSLADNLTLYPSGSQWQFNLCSPGGFNVTPSCVSVTRVITCVGNGSCSGSTLDISSSFTSAPVSTAPFRGYFYGTSGTAFTSLVTGYGGGPTVTAAIKITAMDIHLDTPPNTCTTAAQTGLFDATAAAFVPGTTITLALNATADYHITLTTPALIPAGHRLAFGTAVIWGTCTTNGGGPHYTVEYQMQ